LLKIILLNAVTFGLPYYFLQGLALVLCGRRRKEILSRLPFENLKSPLLLPDGNLLYCLWRDVWWIWAIVDEIYYRRTYDRFFGVEKDSTVVDVGAHIGIYTLKAAKKVGAKGRVIAVEPSDENYQLLVRNIIINRYKNVVPIKLALSDFKGKAKFYLKDGYSTDHSLHEKIDRFERQKIVGVREVAVTTLSKLLHKLHIESIELLKVDAEGAEPEVLRGSQELLARHRISKIVIAAYHTSEESGTIKGYLEKLGYKVNIIELGHKEFLYATCRKQG